MATFLAVPDPMKPTSVRRHRAIWISDVLLGSRDARPDVLADFLRSNAASFIYLVGDFFDGLAMSQLQWVDQQAAVMAALAKHFDDPDCEIVWLTGERDVFLRSYKGRALMGKVPIWNEAVHVTASGMRLLVTHGEKFEGSDAYPRWLVALGRATHPLLFRMNRLVNKTRRRLRRLDWRRAWHNVRVEEALPDLEVYETKFKMAHAKRAASLGLDGVVCGHIQRPDMQRIGNVLYCNVGDWVNNCTALVEDSRGNLEILRWERKYAADQAAAARGL